MKTIKRIIAILLLVVFLALVGYMVFTGSRLSENSEGGVAYEQTTEV